MRGGFWACAAAALAACDRADPERERPRPPEEVQELAAEGSGSIRGRVTFRGEHRRAPIMIPPGACQEHHPTNPLREDIVVGEDGGLRDVLVYVKEGLMGRYPVPREPAVLDQVACLYVPHILALRVGQDLKVLNSDDMLHNVHIMTKRSRERNFSMSDRGEFMLRAPFGAPELNIPVGCDQHGWMDARIHVLDHPKFAVTPGTGAFGIEGLPAGRYTLAAYHVLLGERTVEVELEEAQVLDGTDFEFVRE